MIYFALLVFLGCAWVLPWWGLAIVAFALGFALPKEGPMQTSLAAALAWATMAYLMDGKSHGVISQRMSGLFSLPAASLIFLVMGLLAAMTTLLAYNAGAAIRTFISHKRIRSSLDPEVT